MWVVLSFLKLLRNPLKITISINVASGLGLGLGLGDGDGLVLNDSAQTIIGQLELKELRVVIKPMDVGKAHKLIKKF